jgi:hypothetical protein
VGGGKVEIQKQDSHFPTAQNRLRRKEKNGRLHKTVDAPGLISPPRTYRNTPRFQHPIRQQYR